MTNQGSDTVSVITDTTNAVVATVNVGTGPLGIAYDSDRGEIFVANSDNNTVSVITDATNAVVATIPVGSEPTYLAYDPARGEVFVGIAHWRSPPYANAVSSDF